MLNFSYRMSIRQYISLSTLVLNNRFTMKTMETEIYTSHFTPYNQLYLRKAGWNKRISNTIITLHKYLINEVKIQIG